MVFEDENQQQFPIQMPNFRPKVRNLSISQNLSVEPILCQMAPFFSHQNGVIEVQIERP